MSAVSKASALSLLSGVIFIALVFWGLPGPKAGKINNPVASYGQVVLTGVDGKRCSIQAGFELNGKRYTTSQIPYARGLCSYRLGQRVPLAYNRLDPSQSAALQKVTDHPLWPALLAGVIFAGSLVWLLTLLLPRLSFERSAPKSTKKDPPAPQSKRKQNPVPDPETKPDAELVPDPGAPSDSPSSSGSKTPTIPRSGVTPPGWYPARGRLRWWNGQRWTDNWQDL